MSPPGLDFLPKIQWGVRYVDRDATRAPAPAISTPTTSACFNIPISSRAARLAAVQLRLPRRQPQAVAAHLARADVRQRVGQPRRAAPVQHRSGRSRRTTINDTNDPNPEPRARSRSTKSRSRATHRPITNSTPAPSDIDGQLGVRVVQTKDTSSEPCSARRPAPAYRSAQKQIYRLAAQREHEHPLHARSGSCALRQPRRARGRPSISSIRRSTSTRRRDATRPAGLRAHRRRRKSVPEAAEVEKLRRQPRILFLEHRLRFARGVPRDMRASSSTDLPLSDPDPETGLPLEITGPVNTNKGRIKGFEAQVSTFFDWDWVPTGRAASAPRPTSLTSIPRSTLGSVAGAAIVECASRRVEVDL